MDNDQVEGKFINFNCPYCNSMVLKIGGWGDRVQ
jgi:hypothetical protein